MQQPLAYRMRPRTLEDVVGQQQLVGPGFLSPHQISAQTHGLPRRPVPFSPFCSSFSRPI